MKKVLIIGMMLICSVGYTQDISDKIILKKVFGGQVFEQNGRRLKMAAVINQMQSNPEALEIMKKAKSNYSAASVIGFIGGFLVGFPLGAAAAGDTPNWVMAGAGVGVLLTTIPLNSAFKKHATQALKLYNNDGKSANAYSLNLGLTNHGLGLSVNFK